MRAKVIVKFSRQEGGKGPDEILWKLKFNILHKVVYNDENRIQDRSGRERGPAILNEFKIANFTKTLDLIPKAGSCNVLRVLIFNSRGAWPIAPPISESQPQAKLL